MSANEHRTQKSILTAIPAVTWLVLAAALYPAQGLLTPLLASPHAEHAQQVRAYLDEQGVSYIIDSSFRFSVGAKVHDTIAAGLIERGLLGKGEATPLFSVAPGQNEAGLASTLEASSTNIRQAAVSLLPNETLALRGAENAGAYIRVVSEYPMTSDEIKSIKGLIAEETSIKEASIQVSGIVSEALAYAASGEAR